MSVWWLVVIALFVAHLLIGGLTGFNQTPLAMRLPASLLLIWMGMAIARAVYR